MSSTVVLIREERFIRTPNGRVWSRWGTGEHTWLPFLTAFSEIALVARVQDAVDPPPGGTLVSHDRVRIWPITYFQGPREYLKRARRVNRDLNRYVSTDGPLVLRIPSPL